MAEELNGPVLGIDGCLNGWCCVRIENNMQVTVRIFHNLNELWEENNDSGMALIDMPIGLKSGNNPSRKCDKEARKILLKRSSSIFPTPSREILGMSTYQEANSKSKRLTGKGISKQTWNIMPKIKELDLFLRNNRVIVPKFQESHPEVCFILLNNKVPLKFNKKTPEGVKERIKIIKLNWFDQKFSFKLIKDTLKGQKVKTDDLLDAIILGIVALRGKDSIQFLPKDYNIDSEGLPMKLAIPGCNPSFQKGF